MTLAEFRTYIGVTFGPNGAGGIDGAELRDALLEVCNRIEAGGSWQPTFALVADGARIVLKITDWTGGQGVKPPVNVFVGVTGLVVSIALAVDLRGAKGDKGDTGAPDTWFGVGTSSSPGSNSADVYRTGKVGIGLNTPSQKLEVNGSVAYSPYLVYRNGAVDAAYIGAGPAVGGLAADMCIRAETGLLIFGRAGGAQTAVMDQSGRFGIGVLTPTSAMHVNGATGHQQLRLEKSYTPANSSDPNGLVGQVCWDANYIYWKTAGGWKRSAIGTTF